MSEILHYLRLNATQHNFSNKIRILNSVKDLKQLFIQNCNDPIFIDVLKNNFPIYYEILEPLILLK
jgi:predicted O-methyltransferase YrrM